MLKSSSWKSPWGITCTYKPPPIKNYHNIKLIALNNLLTIKIYPSNKNIYNVPQFIKNNPKNSTQKTNHVLRFDKDYPKKWEKWHSMMAINAYFNQSNEKIKRASPISISTNHEAFLQVFFMSCSSYKHNFTEEEPKPTKSLRKFTILLKFSTQRMHTQL